MKGQIICPFFMNKVLWKRKTSKIPVRKKPARRFSLPKLKLNLHFNFGFSFKKLAFILLLPFIIGGILMFMSTDIFKVKKIEIYGTNQLSDIPILEKMNSYNGSNIFTLNANTIKSSISESSIFLKDIYIEKTLPDTLGVYVVERFPKEVIINFQGAYLVDNENIVIKTLSDTEGLGLTPDEIDLLLGFTGSDSPVIKEKILKELPEEEKAKFDFAKVDQATKDRLYIQLLNNMRTSIQRFFDQNSKAVNTTEFANFEKIYILNNDDYQIGSEIKENLVNFPEDIIAYFREKSQFTPTALTWTDDFTLKVETLEQKTFIFSNRPDRELWKQVQELDLILHRLEIEKKDFSLIDVTVSTISVE